MELLVIGPIGAEECICALESNEPDFEDGFIRTCVELNDVDPIITRGCITRDFITRGSAAYKDSSVRAASAAEYLEIVAES